MAKMNKNNITKISYIVLLNIKKIEIIKVYWFHYIIYYTSNFITYILTYLLTMNSSEFYFVARRVMLNDGCGSVHCGFQLIYSNSAGVLHLLSQLLVRNTTSGLHYTSVNQLPIEGSTFYNGQTTVMAQGLSYTSGLEQELLFYGVPVYIMGLPVKLEPEVSAVAEMLPAFDGDCTFKKQSQETLTVIAENVARFIFPQIEQAVNDKGTFKLSVSYESVLDMLKKIPSDELSNYGIFDQNDIIEYLGNSHIAALLKQEMDLLTGCNFKIAVPMISKRFQGFCISLHWHIIYPEGAIQDFGKGAAICLSGQIFKLIQDFMNGLSLRFPNIGSRKRAKNALSQFIRERGYGTNFSFKCTNTLSKRKRRVYFLIYVPEVSEALVSEAVFSEAVGSKPKSLRKKPCARLDTMAHAVLLGSFDQLLKDENYDIFKKMWRFHFPDLIFSEDEDAVDEDVSDEDEDEDEDEDADAEPFDTNDYRLDLIKELEPVTVIQILNVLGFKTKFAKVEEVPDEGNDDTPLDDV